ncbi:malate dehydrogenase [Candidatus Blochmanniella vafra str. BVAF]|uniref:Probable malate:quinone oxidoreductase n=1 Tax=Blochmanniella vafra (strain BVAF) TaxID=859654 RepID=E8Q6E3_BLOVB|nr:malate dehydrogenase (quinone) [Candidatus Blochmannia vafer]ADV33912.1 malate dehydrogenase [Candidatus Blochmannia vafer str. BVAF]
MNSNTFDQTPVQLNKKNVLPPIDVVLIGAGIMSTTLGMFIAMLEPNWKINVYERLHKPAQESSNAWNNAGTGHASFCELNYTEYNDVDKSINIEKALSINTAFELSLQFWAFLTKNNILKNPKSFIRNIPHISFVTDDKHISFLRKRFQALKTNNIFNGMIYSENSKQIESWIPLIMTGRNKNQKVAATYMEMGTDVDFEEITQQILNQLNKNSNFNIYFQHNVTSIQPHNNNTCWNISIINTQHKNKQNVYAKHVFIGGGGQSLNLLQTSGIRETKGYAGFPVGGQFLITYNPKIVSQHSAKVYGQSSLNMPPMSVPHMDARILNGNKVLLFGPFATFSGKFLKYGSWWDLFYSLNKHNLIPIIQAGLDNKFLIKYLIHQVTMSHKDRINSLKKFYPEAHIKDWSLIQAGQRVQIIKKNQHNRGTLQFGTEIVSSNNGSLSALLGASPGASIAVSIAIRLLHIMFNTQIHSSAWQTKLQEIIPVYSQYIQNNNIIITNQLIKNTRDALSLTFTE